MIVATVCMPLPQRTEKVKIIIWTYICFYVQVIHQYDLLNVIVFNVFAGMEAKCLFYNQ